MNGMDKVRVSEWFKVGHQGIRALRFSSRGFSMVELMISVGLAGILMIGLVSGYITQKSTYESEEGLLEMQLNADIAMKRISELIRNAGIGSQLNFLDSPPAYVSLNSLDGAMGISFNRVFRAFHLEGTAVSV